MGSSVDVEDNLRINPRHTAMVAQILQSNAVSRLEMVCDQSVPICQVERKSLTIIPIMGR